MAVGWCWSKRFRAKHAPGLDSGWLPIRVKKTRQDKAKTKEINDKRIPFRRRPV
jgi:hypothetical protein